MIKHDFFYDIDYTDSELSDLFSSIKAEYDSGDIGYYHLLGSDTTDIKEFANSSKWVESIVVVGIGGSSLGVKAVHELLYISYENRKDIRFLESVGPNAVKKVLDGLNIDRTLFIIISKSGTTIETITNFKYILKSFNIDLYRDQDHFIVVTDKNSNLDKFAQRYKLTSFYIPKNVGGRFSIFSSVGLLPLAILGYNIDEFLYGAETLRESFFNREYDNLLQKALFFSNKSKDIPINVLFSYSSTFRYFNQWYVQLWGESLGKIDSSGRRVGLTPVGLIGSVDQHSFLQLLTEGPQDKSVTFIKVNDFRNDIKIPDINLEFLQECDYVNGTSFNNLINAQCDATMDSVIKSGIDVDRVQVDNFSEKSVGFLMFYFELLTSLTALAMDVNAYNQPGVELGKKILRGKFYD
jgi:glucose-6-phosphate isomerase